MFLAVFQAAVCSLKTSLLLQDVPPEDLPLTRLPRSREGLTDPSILTCVSRTRDSPFAKTSLTWTAAKEVWRLLPTFSSFPCTAPLPGAAVLTLATLAQGMGNLFVALSHCTCSSTASPRVSIVQLIFLLTGRVAKEKAACFDLLRSALRSKRARAVAVVSAVPRGEGGQLGGVSWSWHTCGTKIRHPGSE